MLKPLIATIALTLTTSSMAMEGLSEKLIGNWCLNTEEYDGDVTIVGSKWTFKEDGTYITVEAYTSTDAYTVEGASVKLDNFGTLKVSSISDTEMKGKIYSNYHFTKDECLPKVAQAFKTTELNNAVIKKDLAKVKELVESGVDINQPDTKSSQKSTPLMVAVRFGDIETVKYLLSKNPDLSVENYAGATALDLAKRAGNDQAVKLLEQAE